MTAHSFGKIVFLALAAFMTLASQTALAANPWQFLLGAQLKAPANDAAYQSRFAPQWRRVRQEEAENPVFLPGGRARLPRPYDFYWNNLLTKLPAMDLLQRLRAVSGFINVQLGGKSDQVVYGMGEHFASPREFVSRHGGDCEDFAICKYFALRALGWASADLRILLVEVPSRRSWHAVLAANINGAIYIADNNFRPRDLALPQERMKGFFVLYYAFNEDGAWFYVQNP
jgi:predicted transglutaminase-like cysteine proteinase